MTQPLTYLSPPLVAHAATQHGDVVRLRDDASTLPRRYLLVGVERERPGCPPAATTPSLPFGAERFARVLDQLQTVLPRDLLDRIQFGWLTKRIHSEDSLGPLGDRCSYPCGINVVGVRPDIHEYRLHPFEQEAVGRSDEAERRGDDLVAFLQSQRPHDEVQRRRPTVHGDAVCDASDMGQSILKLRQAWPQAQVIAPEDVQYCFLITCINPLRSCLLYTSDAADDLPC